MWTTEETNRFLTAMERLATAMENIGEQMRIQNENNKETN